MAHTSGPFSQSCPAGRTEGTRTGRGSNTAIEGLSLKWNSRVTRPLCHRTGRTPTALEFKSPGGAAQAGPQAKDHAVVEGWAAV